MRFTAYSHPNILAKHPTTIEFTKDKDVSLQGDCIIGVKADFSLKEIKKILHYKKIRIRIKAGRLEEVITAQINHFFSHDTEMVIRKSDFLSDRTLAIKADKSANELDRKFVEKLKDNAQKIEVEIIGL